MKQRMLILRQKYRHWWWYFINWRSRDTLCCIRNADDCFLGRGCEENDIHRVNNVMAQRVHECTAVRSPKTVYCGGNDKAFPRAPQHSVENKDI